MSRPSEINTKTMSVRVPMQFYLDFLNEAIEKNLGLGDYMSYKLMSKTEDRSKEIEELKETITSLESENKSLKAQIDDLSSKNTSQGKKSSEELNKLSSSLEQAKKLISELRKDAKANEALRLELGTRLNDANKFIKKETFSSKQF